MKRIKIMMALLIAALSIHSQSTFQVTKGSHSSQAGPVDFNNFSGDNGEFNGSEAEPYVFWIHGLNGDIGSWADASLASERNVTPKFKARKIKSVTDLDYSQSNGLEEAGGQLSRLIEPFRALQLFSGEDPRKNFLIAHSQGGLVSRAMLHLDHCVDYNPNAILGYGALATYGTPHGGAQILNNKYMFIDFTSDMCEGLNAGPLQELGNRKFKFQILGIEFEKRISDFVPIEKTVELVCDFLGEVLVPGLTLIQTPRITEDYEVGAAYLEELNASCENQAMDEMDKVAFYGIELEDGLIFRTLKFFGLSVNAYDYFDANEDDDILEAMNDNRMTYVSKREYHAGHLDLLKTVSRAHGCQSPSRRILNKNFCDLLDRAIRRSEALVIAWNKGVEWFDKVDDQYKEIIGALDVQIRQEDWCQCLDDQTGDIFEFRLPQGQTCHSTSGDCVAITKTFYDKVYKPSDGVVLAESAMAMPDANAIVLMDRSSHMQMRNDRNTCSTLRDLYDGMYGSDFRVEERK